MLITPPITQEMPARLSHYQRGPLRGLFVPSQEQLHLFDSFTMAGQIKRAISIGRLRRCDIQLADPAVSALHCEIERRQDGTCIIIDADSKNGIFVNDVKVTCAELWPGMWVFIGHTELIAVGQGQEVPVLGRTYTSYLVRAREVHGTAESAADLIHRSASTIYRAIQKRVKRKRV
jgi:pSer/pThr/pTyr-binding forkhead associated (FHA) protein